MADGTKHVAASVAAMLRALVEAHPHLVAELREQGVDVRPQLRALGPVDLDVTDVPELREIGQPIDPPSQGKDATGYLAELEWLRGEIIGETPEVDRWRVRASRLNLSRERGPAARATLLEAIAEHGWPAVRELMAFGWREVAAGRRDGKLQAHVLTSSGGIGALLDLYGRAQQAERERAAAEEAERARARRDAEERRPAAGAPVSEYAAGLLRGLVDAGAVGGE